MIDVDVNHKYMSAALRYQIYSSPSLQQEIHELSYTLDTQLSSYQLSTPDSPQTYYSANVDALVPTPTCVHHDKRADCYCVLNVECVYRLRNALAIRDGHAVVLYRAMLDSLISERGVVDHFLHEAPRDSVRETGQQEQQGDKVQGRVQREGVADPPDDDRGREISEEVVGEDQHGHSDVLVVVARHGD